MSAVAACMLLQVWIGNAASTPADNVYTPSALMATASQSSEAINNFFAIFNAMALSTVLH